MSRCHNCARIATVSLWKTTFGGYQRGTKAHQLVVCDLLRKIWLEGAKQAAGGENRQKCQPAKVFRAHAVPQGMCENLINALKLLANPQEDRDGLVQSIVTNLCEGSRKGLTEGLRNVKQVDNHRALEVGGSREGRLKVLLRYVRRPKCEESCPEVLVRKSPRN